MGIHVGEPKRLTDAVTRRVEFVGPPVNTAARLTTLAHGGQILLSESAWERLKQADWLKERNRCACLGKFELTDSLPGTGANFALSREYYDGQCPTPAGNLYLQVRGCTSCARPG
jgi:hypothetical protein